ncbi:MAG: hypothetical protein RL141_318 [Candidatus Parcubacteria bacterium]|jgi:hypothetical protein
MSLPSALIHRLALVFSALVALGVMAWIALRVVAPVAVLPPPPAKTQVRFDPKTDVRTHPLFSTLSAVIRGDLQPGPMGRTNPFVGSGQALPAAQPVASRLGTVQEIPLGEGVRMRALAPAKDGAILALVDRGSLSFEIRRYRAGEEGFSVAATWQLTAGSVQDAWIPVAFLQDGFGKVWLLSRGGYVGSIQTDGKPSWDATPVFMGADGGSLEAWGALAVDGAGRLWATDGQRVAAGTDGRFSPVDLLVSLSDAQRAALAAAPGIPGAAPRLGWGDAAPEAPRRLAALADGRMSVITPALGLVFPLSLQGRAEVFDLIDARAGVPFAFGTTGELWARTGEGLVRLRGAERQAYNDMIVLPKQALLQPRLAETGRAGLVALDYVPDATVLWEVVDGEWVARATGSAGAQPQDSAERIVADGEGNVWAILRQRGLLLVRPPQR